MVGDAGTGSPQPESSPTPSSSATPPPSSTSSMPTLMRRANLGARTLSSTVTSAVSSDDNSTLVAGTSPRLKTLRRVGSNLSTRTTGGAFDSETSSLNGGGSDDAASLLRPPGASKGKARALEYERQPVVWAAADGDPEEDESISSASEDEDGASQEAPIDEETLAKVDASPSPSVDDREREAMDPRDMLREQLKKSQKRISAGPPPREGVQPTSKDDEETTAKEEGSGDLLRHYAPRRYFILSSAGKLIFTTDQDEEAATGYVGVMQAIVSIFADEGDRIRYVDAGDTKIALMLKNPIYLVCVSTWGEPEGALRHHLEYLHSQILALVTMSQLQGIFKRRANFDLRRLLEGAENFFTGLVDRLQTSLPMLTSCLEVYRLDSATREEVAKCLTPTTKITDLLYAFVVAHGRLVTLVRPKAHSVHPSDMHLLLSMISSSSSFQESGAESWMPICFPRFNATGFLYAYISFVQPGVGVVLVSGDREGFATLKTWGGTVKEKLEAGKGKLLKALEVAEPLQRLSLGELGIPSLRHFMYKSRMHIQIVAPSWEGGGEYEPLANRYRLLTLYQKIHETLHLSGGGGAPSVPSGGSKGSSGSSAKPVVVRTAQEAVFGWSTSAFELYIVVSPLLPTSAVVATARAVTRWINTNEAKLFLSSAPTF